MNGEGIKHRIPESYHERKGEVLGDGVSISSPEYSRMIDLYGSITRLYQQFFPEVSVDPKVQKLDIYRNGPFANGEFKETGRTLRMDLGVHPEDPEKMRLNTNYDSRVSEYVMDVPKRLGEIIVMSHEIGHAMFVQTVNPDTYRYRGDSNGAVEFLPINEGFATFLGNMFIERLIANPETLELSPPLRIERYLHNISL